MKKSSTYHPFGCSSLCQDLGMNPAGYYITNICSTPHMRDGFIDVELSLEPLREEASRESHQRIALFGSSFCSWPTLSMWRR